MNWLERSLKRAESITVRLCKLSMYFIVAMCIFITADVTATYMFNKPIAGASEISEYFLPLVVFLPFGYTLLAGGHPRVDSLLVHFPRRLVIVLDIISLFLVIGFIGLLSWEVAKVSYTDWVNKVYHPYASIPLPSSIPSLLSVICFVLLIIAAITLVTRQIIGALKGKIVGMKTWKEAGGQG